MKNHGLIVLLLLGTFALIGCTDSEDTKVQDHNHPLSTLGEKCDGYLDCVGDLRCRNGTCVDTGEIIEKNKTENSSSKEEPKKVNETGTEDNMNENTDKIEEPGEEIELKIDPTEILNLNLEELALKRSDHEDFQKKDSWGEYILRI